MAKKTKSEDSAILSGVADSYNKRLELGGQGSQPIKYEKVNWKRMWFTWGSLITAVLGSTFYLGQKVESVNNSISTNTSNIEKAQRSQSELQQEVGINTDTIKEHNEKLTKLKTTQDLTRQSNEKNFDRQERILERIAAKVGADAP